MQYIFYFQVKLIEGEFLGQDKLKSTLIKTLETIYDEEITILLAMPYGSGNDFILKSQ